MSWQRPNIGSRVTREGHARFWERPEVKFLRATQRLQGIVRARRLSRVTMRNIRQNLFFAFVFNALAVPIAAGVLYPAIGLLLNPMIASAAMSMSSVLVVTNALRLRTVRL
jgi:cation transport ATPase